MASTLRFARPPRRKSMGGLFWPARCGLLGLHIDLRWGGGPPTQSGVEGPDLETRQARQNRQTRPPLRRDQSLPERLLWRHLRGSPEGITFRRQHPAGPYILDFFCPRANLAIEIDGIAHDTGDRQGRDAARDAFLDHARFEVVRTPASEVLRDATQVAQSLVDYAAARLNTLGKSSLPVLLDDSSPQL